MHVVGHGWIRCGPFPPDTCLTQDARTEQRNLPDGSAAARATTTAYCRNHPTSVRHCQSRETFVPTAVKAQLKACLLFVYGDAQQGAHFLPAHDSAAGNPFRPETTRSSPRPRAGRRRYRNSGSDSRHFHICFRFDAHRRGVVLKRDPAAGRSVRRGYHGLWTLFGAPDAPRRFRRPRTGAKATATSGYLVSGAALSHTAGGIVRTDQNEVAMFNAYAAMINARARAVPRRAYCHNSNASAPPM